ncbi:MAG: glycosyltransferase [Acidobacteria bacterium]|nr:glycosyltransferase [Acidobacteriota bacterium]
MNVPEGALRITPSAPGPHPAAVTGATSSGRVRLLVLTVGFTVGGAEQLILVTAPRLQRLGFDVTVACLKGWGPIGDELERSGVRAVALGASGPFDVRAAGCLLALLRRERIQILHAHLFLANHVARVIGRMAGVPVVIATHHDTDLEIGFAGRLFEGATASMSDMVLACSEAVRRHVIRAYGLRHAQVRTLRNALPDPGASWCDPVIRARIRQELGAAPGERLVGTVGRLIEPKKGIPVFLAAARQIAEKLPDVRFVVVGDGPARELLEERATSQGVAHRTTFAGERRDIPRVMDALDLLVQPSNWEGFGLTLLEAMAVGRPVVATRVGGIPEVVLDGQTGTLVPPGDPTALAAACLDLLSDGERAARFGEAGRDRARAEFSIDRLVNDTAALYRELHDRTRSGTDGRRVTDRGRAL